MFNLLNMSSGIASSIDELHQLEKPNPKEHIKEHWQST